MQWPTTRRAVLGALASTAIAAVCCGDHPAASADGPTLSEPVPQGRATHTPGLLSDAVDVAPGLSIRPRSDWGADLPPKGLLFGEDVRFLLVHHSASPNAISDPRDVIRQVYAFHTGSSKRWADVAYNFFVAPDGSVWEGRSGSLDGAVRADASGGNQGFSQLVCLLGDFQAVQPTPAAQASLVATLAWLTERHRLGSHDGASATFTSRGSDKFRAGTTITTPIVSAHRDVTFTLCPGDAAVALLPRWRRSVYDIVSAGWKRDGLQRATRSSLRPPSV